MAKVSFRLVMPERELLATEADMVVVPGSEGDFGVLPGHAPLVSTVRPGVLEVYQGSKVQQRFLVAGGFAEVTPESAARCWPTRRCPSNRSPSRSSTSASALRATILLTPLRPPRRPPPRRIWGIAQDLKRAQTFYASR